MIRLSRLCFKGSSTESAVLCTQDKTYAVKTVDNTNLVLLVDEDISGEQQRSTQRSPLNLQQVNAVGDAVGLATQQAKVYSALVVHLHINLGFTINLLLSINRQIPHIDVFFLFSQNSSAAENPPITVTATVSSHLELIPIAPNLEKLDVILSDNLYTADTILNKTTTIDEENAMDIDTATATTNGGSFYIRQQQIGITWDELLQQVLASPAELSKALKNRRALCIDDKWYGIDSGYLGEVLQLIVLTAVEQGWKDWYIPTKEAVEVLSKDGYPSVVVLHCLDVFSREKNSNTADTTNEEEYKKLDEEAVSVYYGLKLLAERPIWETQQEFLNQWSAIVPEVKKHDYLFILYNNNDLY